MNKFFRSIMLCSLFVTAFAISTFAQDGMEKKEMMAEKKATVVVVRADWCPYCKKIEAYMPELMKEYGDKLEFVVFDITDEETTSASMKLAEEKGLADFFKDNKGAAATVAIIKGGEIKFKANKKTDRETYEKAFKKASE